MSQAQKQTTKAAAVVASQKTGSQTLARPDATAVLTKIEDALLGRQVVIQRAIEILEDAQALLKGRGAWTKGFWQQVWAKRQEGRFCIQGAVRYAALGHPSCNARIGDPECDGPLNDTLEDSNPEDDGWALAEQTLEAGLSDRYHSIPDFNDSEATRKRDVNALFGRALHKLKAQLETDTEKKHDP